MTLIVVLDYETATNPFSNERIMNNTQQTPFVPKWKFPEAQALGEACLGNLTENMTDPDALEAKRDARDLANAVPAEAKPAAPAVAGTPNP